MVAQRCCLQMQWSAGVEDEDPLLFANLTIFIGSTWGLRDKAFCTGVREYFVWVFCVPILDQGLAQN